MKEWLEMCFGMLLGLNIGCLIAIAVFWFIKVWIIGFETWCKMRTEEKERDLEKRMRSKRP
jgi:hypothetical protein